MPKRVPIKAAKQIAEQHSCRQVIVMAWDGERTHIVTYGKGKDDCAQAAAGGNMLKQKWGWPECNDQPSRMRKLETENYALKAELQALRSTSVETYSNFLEATELGKRAADIGLDLLKGKS